MAEALGYVPPGTIGEIARDAAVTDADVAGALSFYPDLPYTALRPQRSDAAIMERNTNEEA